MSLPREHRNRTAKLTQESKAQIPNWLLNEGYYPEPYVLPPSFKVKDWSLREEGRYNGHKELKNGKKKDLTKISFPKTDLTEREFAVMHPHFYHDLVWEINQEWEAIHAFLFNPANKIYSYSFPIPVNEEGEGRKPLRSGRMIYEFLEMAENDLVAEAHQYSHLVRLDITNFYPSIYTHTICWAWEGRNGSEGREVCGKDTSESKWGNRIDRLFQNANDKRTVGIPIGPVVSDLIAELILSERDLKISQTLDREIKSGYLATRFKDDYRILCNSEEAAKRIVKVIIDTLKEFNFVVNEKKTEIQKLPDGLYRPHATKYEPFSFRHPGNLTQEGKIHFKAFENVLLQTLSIHREHPGTSLIEKFLSELFLPKTETKEGVKTTRTLEERFILDLGDYKSDTSIKRVKKTISLLFMLKNESPKSMGKVLSVFEWLLEFSKMDWFKDYLKDQIISEIRMAVVKNSDFELLWLLYFKCRHGFNIDIKRLYHDLRKEKLIHENRNQGTCDLLKNPFVANLRGKKTGKGNITNPFGENLDDIRIFIEPSELGNTWLLEYLDVFDREKEQ